MLVNVAFLIIQVKIEACKYVMRNSVRANLYMRIHLVRMWQIEIIGQKRSIFEEIVKDFLIVFSLFVSNLIKTKVVLTIKQINRQPTSIKKPT